MADIQDDVRYSIELKYLASESPMMIILFGSTSGRWASTNWLSSVADLPSVLGGLDRRLPHFGPLQKYPAYELAFKYSQHFTQPFRHLKNTMHLSRNCSTPSLSYWQKTQLYLLMQVSFGQKDPASSFARRLRGPCPRQ